MRDLLIATSNQGKFAEFFGIFKDLPYRLITKNFSIEEVGKTYAENAILKAKGYGKLSGLLTLADDSGLEVDCLNGQPGVASHRYGQGSDIDRYQKLLKNLKSVPLIKRSARFVSQVALYDPESDKIQVTRGECEGWIAFEPKGSHGFGYDPVFVVKSLGKHFAELTLEEKNRVSHRAKALIKMKKILADPHEK